MFDSESDSFSDLGHSVSDADLVEVSSEFAVGRTSVSGWVTAPFKFLVPSDGVFGRFDPAALRGCHTFNDCLFQCLFV
jgi:hypothetical protein